MPFIVAKEDAGLSRSTSSQDIDALVLAGQRLAVDWVQLNPSGAAELRLAGNYTCPESRNVLAAGDVRFINSARFAIPANAWLNEPIPAASASRSTTPGLMNLAVELIARYEGFRANAYPDPGTGGEPWTIGYGFTQINGQSVSPGQVIGKEEANALLSREISDCIAHLSVRIPFWQEMSPEQQCALTSFAFNNGRDFYGGPYHETITRVLKSKEWSSVPKALLLYVNPGSAVEQGLRRRREEEGRLWMQGVSRVSVAGVARQTTSPFASTESVPLDGLDPRGAEEAGMVGPRKKAPVKPGDSYLLVNDRDQDMEAYDSTGKLIWKIPCRARGQYGEREWSIKNSDTPPGLYKIGKVYKDYEANPSPPCTDTCMSYGWYSFDLEELEGQEAKVGRGGIMIHGGGTACGWPGAWEPRQELFPTHGCIRVRNIDLREKILPLTQAGTVYVGVFQEA
jgi:GH24 family phage-related lysozyme (muramidase)